MPVDYTKLRNITAREIIAALIKDGFSFRHQKGSHQRYRHSDGRRVTVTFHKASGTFPLGTLRSMIEQQAQWNEDDLKRLDLIN
jgi:predicted RNA binding protein YcfA (HicA-like mRNA interferase family)